MFHNIWGTYKFEIDGIIRALFLFFDAFISTFIEQLILL